MERLRFCRKCEKDLPLNLDYFTPRNTDKCGFNLYCKECINKEKRESRLVKREQSNKGGRTCIEGERKCSFCKNTYPSNLDFFGKHKGNNLGLDTYCHNCRHQRNINKIKIIPSHRTCLTCNHEKELNNKNFHPHKNSKDGFSRYCVICVRNKGLNNYYKKKENYQTTHNKTRDEKRDKINQIKTNSGGCKKCKENKIFLLDFHHIDPKNKDFQIAQGESKGWNRLLKEMDKCILLCKNCHSEFHYLEKLNKITIQQYLNE